MEMGKITMEKCTSVYCAQPGVTSVKAFRKLLETHSEPQFHYQVQVHT